MKMMQPTQLLTAGYGGDQQDIMRLFGSLRNRKSNKENTGGEDSAELPGADEGSERKITNNQPFSSVSMSTSTIESANNNSDSSNNSVKPPSLTTI